VEPRSGSASHPWPGEAKNSSALELERIFSRRLFIIDMKTDQTPHSLPRRGSRSHNGRRYLGVCEHASRQLPYGGRGELWWAT
jgi:hypothetical protein